MFRAMIATSIVIGLSRVSCAAPDFEREIAPLLIRRCLECHHATGAAGGLVLTQKALLEMLVAPGYRNA